MNEWLLFAAFAIVALLLVLCVRGPHDGPRPFGPPRLDVKIKWDFSAWLKSCEEMCSRIKAANDFMRSVESTAIPPYSKLVMPESTSPTSSSAPDASASAERYTLEISIVKILEKSDGSRDRQAHRATVESNGLTLEETVDMQKALVPAIVEFLEKDAPQA